MIPRESEELKMCLEPLTMTRKVKDIVRKSLLIFPYFPYTLASWVLVQLLVKSWLVVHMEKNHNVKGKERNREGFPKSSSA